MLPGKSEALKPETTDTNTMSMLLHSLTFRCHDYDLFTERFNCEIQ